MLEGGEGEAFLFAEGIEIGGESGVVGEDLDDLALEGGEVFLEANDRHRTRQAAIIQTARRGGGGSGRSRTQRGRR